MGKGGAELFEHKLKRQPLQIHIPPGEDDPHPLTGHVQLIPQYHRPGKEERQPQNGRHHGLDRPTRTGYGQGWPARTDLRRAVESGQSFVGAQVEKSPDPVPLALVDALDLGVILL